MKADANSMDHGSVNPFRNWATVMDCGDISNTPFDKLVAIHELEKGMKAMNAMKPKNESAGDAVRFITIGGDHTISKPHFFDMNLILTRSSSPNLTCSPFNMGTCRSPPF